jgi:hypothetical protein
MPYLAPCFSRGETQRILGVSRNTFENYLRTGIIKPTDDGVGKGQNRKFTQFAVTTAALLTQLNRETGLNTDGMVEIAGRFRTAENFVESNDLSHVCHFAASLVEYRFDIQKDGFASFPASPLDAPMQLFEKGTPRYKDDNGRDRLQLTWEQIVHHHRANAAKLSVEISDEVVQLCKDLSRDEFRCLVRYNGLNHTRGLVPPYRFLLLWRTDEGEWHDQFDDILEPASRSTAFLAVDVRQFKLRFWGKP